jgi:hypothetical protein
VPNLPICNISLQGRLCACASGTREHEVVSAVCVCACVTRQDLTARACVYMVALFAKTWLQERLSAYVCLRVRYWSRLDCKSLCWPLCVWACATCQALTARASAWTCMCHLSRFACKHLYVYACNITLQGPFMQTCVCYSPTLACKRLYSMLCLHETAKAT